MHTVFSYVRFEVISERILFNKRNKLKLEIENQKCHQEE